MFSPIPTILSDGAAAGLLSAAADTVISANIGLDVPQASFGISFNEEGE